MRFATYISDGHERYGLVVRGGMVDLNSRTEFHCLRDAIEADALEQLGRDALHVKPDHSLSEIEFRPVIPQPNKIFFLGLNYATHAAEGGNEPPQYPQVFSKFNDTLVGHDQPILRPRVSTNFDFEGELAVIVGRAGRHIPAEQAMRYVAGFSCFLDGSVRDFQKYSVTAGKNFPRTSPLGPWMVTQDELPRPGELDLVTRLNGREVQRANTRELVHSVEGTIAYISTWTALSPGDVIATGTPSGVGHRRKPQLWMKASDVIEVEISGIGTLRNVVVDE